MFIQTTLPRSMPETFRTACTFWSACATCAANSGERLPRVSRLPCPETYSVLPASTPGLYADVFPDGSVWSGASDVAPHAEEASISTIPARTSRQTERCFSRSIILPFVDLMALQVRNETMRARSQLVHGGRRRDVERTVIGVAPRKVCR